MGQRESKPSSTAPAAKKTSYYELLGVERTATDEELKRAYRARALALHPDRNFGNEDEATALFAEIQAAYEVLSDPQDRAWYDTYELAATESHEDGFKRTATPGRRGRDQPDILDAGDLTTFFGEYHGVKRSSLRTDTTFWTAVSGLFDRLSREEVNAAIIAGERDSVPEYPPLGAPLSGAENDYETTAKPFYAAWSGFATRKTFAWLDRWDEEDGEDRRIRRAMEKENKKHREAQVREFNTAVRMLVAFLKKCDPRVEERNAGMVSPEEAERIARERVNEQKRRAKEANEARLREAMKNQQQIPVWDAHREGEAYFSEESDEDDDYAAIEQFECVACNKTFKSAKQYEAHERSKRHRKTVWELRKFMVQEDADLHLGGPSDSQVTTQQEEKEDSHAKMSYDTVLTTKDYDVAEAIADLEMNPSVAHIDSERSRNDDDDDEEEEKEEEEEEEEEEISHSDQLNSNKPIQAVSASPKLGKAAQKRARKAAQKVAAASQEDDSQLAFKCAKCNAAFPSRTRLFQHIKDFGHAAPVQTGGGGKKKKGKR